MAGNCNRPPDKVYTGSAIIGLSTMHKSNIVPVFSKEEALASRPASLEQLLGEQQ